MGKLQRPIEAINEPIVVVWNTLQTHYTCYKHYKHITPVDVHSQLVIWVKTMFWLCKALIVYVLKMY